MFIKRGHLFIDHPVLELQQEITKIAILKNKLCDFMHLCFKGALILNSFIAKITYYDTYNDESSFCLMML